MIIQHDQRGFNFFTILVNVELSLCITAMTNEQLMDRGNHMMDETDQAIERGRKVGLFPNTTLSFPHTESKIDFIVCYSIFLVLEGNN